LFYHHLRDQQTVIRIAVVSGKSGLNIRMLNSDWHHGEPQIGDRTKSR
jgi:hypothetical protein